MFNIVLISPQIPWNTGAIGRLAVNTNSKLHLIEPLGFSIDEKSVKRAGLDYWDKLAPTLWKSFDEFLDANISKQDRFFFATTKTQQVYFSKKFQPDDFLFFGSETAGIPEEILNKFTKNNITIPMSKNGRSLNLAMSVSIILYKAIEQNFTTFETLN
jgi:tRNA (cytidine/uridine-2'-O-)-methyltransferase